MFKSMKKLKKSKHAVGDIVAAELDHNVYIIGLISGIKEKKGVQVFNIYWSDDMDQGDTYTIDNIKIVSLAYNNLKNRYDEAYVREWIKTIKSDNV